MPQPIRTVVTINSTGRQTASFIRVASAVGWRVKAQIRNCEGLVAEELAELPNVELVEGDLTQNKKTLVPFLNELFSGAQVAFINTTHWGDEVAIGKACADAAKKAGIQHYVYSSMPDHSIYNPEWKALPLWSQKFAVENYVRQIGIPSTFLITGIYNNNFTSLPYPLFQMELQDDGSFIWQAPFHPNDPLPWLDAEHDVGPALLQIFKMGAKAWKGQRVILAFERLTPLQVCARFSRGVGRPVRYVHGPIKIEVHIPSGYREHLEILEETLGNQRAPYFGPTYEYPNEARSLWEGHRGIEEYAREVFPLEESANGLTWMDDASNGDAQDDGILDADDVDGSADGTGSGLGRTPIHISGIRTPWAHPEAEASNFFVGSC
ncbi:NmrA-domain-containing protein [Myriangium duriaei CBS 260.36]|uniref:NmrA-domain-containing protein n=1 Tax=Myriangium duriaei CBS 260.36 TaxID=1168546 RepID=A0A9P4J1F7_9PEZI|nr:NmrA-domain-containing protein [Myriangium duriaei CBS 260.36]